MSVEILTGDCREVLRAMEADSFHACVTDPPYHLTEIKGWRGGYNATMKSGRTPAQKAARSGFMGKTWDGGDVAFRPETWAEVWRVLKPGAHLLAFGGTRGFHRMVCAIEDAGFEIRDTIMWVYGCLSEDTEILTADGWKPGPAVEVGERVAAWNPETGAITLEPVQETFRAPWRGDLVRFVNDDTDQLLTPNHRVYHRPSKRGMTAGIRSRWYEPAWECSEASDINRWNPIKLPCAGLHDGHGIGGEDYAALLGWIWTEGGFDKTGSGVRIYQSESANPVKVAEIEALTSRVVPGRSRYDRRRAYTYGNTVRQYDETCWYFSGELAARVRADLPNKSPDWPLLWRMTLAEKRAFWDAAMKGDGCGDDFYQNDRADLEWAQVLLATMGLRGKVAMRALPRTGGSLCITPRDSTELQARHLRQASAPYEGDVWCVRVPTGAFVARRNGKVFITGNSGFPKSLDVSKSIDRAAGAEREVVGPSPRHGGGIKGAGSSYELPPEPHLLTAPSTDAAREWAGWGTALKPAVEMICVARKPSADVSSLEVWQITGWDHWCSSRADGEEKILTGRALHPGARSFQARLDKNGVEVAREDRGPYEPFALDVVAANVLKHGCGALNIDAGRVAGVGNKTFERHAGDRSREQYRTGTTGDGIATDLGRWPANLCHDGSPEVLEAFARFGSEKGASRPVLGDEPSNQTKGIYGGGILRMPGAFHGDTGTAARFFKSCEFEPGERFMYCGKAGKDERVGNHPTVKPVALMEWLVGLVTPPGGRVLDCFGGTGSTAVACERLGFDCVLIEQDPQSVADAHEKIRRMRARRMIGDDAPASTPLGGQMGLAI